jgi:2-oxoglutarate dehydrogenase E2 component (dihydrolipoamide succinyltransferase)
MAIEVKVPAVGESITSGVVSIWHKKSGEFVNEGEPLFTLETDKVSTEIVAEKPGLLETKVPEGQEVKIGEVVATIDDSKQRAGEEQKVEKARDEKKEPADKKKEPKPEKKVAEQKEAAGDGESQPTAAATTPLSPAVRRIVEEEKLEPQKISGTGRGGRLTKTDVLTAAHDRGKADSSAVALAKAEEKIQTRETEPSPDGRFVRKKMSPLRRKIAQQLVMAQHTAAILTTFNECDMSPVQQLRSKAQEEFTKKNGVKLGLMSFFIKACVEALKTVPVVNGRIEDDDFIQNNFARRKIKDRGSAGGNVYHNQRRSIRIAFCHADLKSATKRHSRHAQNHAAAGRGRREGGSPPNDVSRTQLRPPCDRWERSRHFSCQSEGMY